MSGNASPDLVAKQLTAHAAEIARRTTERHFSSVEGLSERLGEAGRAKCTEDAVRHVSYLSSAISQESPALFADYVAWAKILIVRLGLSEDDLARNLAALKDATREVLENDVADAAARYLDAGLEMLPDAGDSADSFLAASEPHAELARQYITLLLEADRHAATQLILDAVEGGVSVHDVYLHVFQRSQYEIGRLWQMNEVSVAQEHFCTAATQLIMSQLYPRIFAFERVNRRVVAASVGGDLHEIGIRMVADFFEMEGWDSMYLGANTPLPGIVQSVTEFRPDVLAISATMTYHVPHVGEVIRMVREKAPRGLRILVGGYPFRVDAELWRRIGADAFGVDALDAVAQAKRIVGDGNGRSASDGVTA